MSHRQKTRKQAKRRSHVNSEIHLKTWNAYQRAWGPVHETEREELLRSSVSDNILYTDPSSQTHGLQELMVRIAQSQQQLRPLWRRWPTRSGNGLLRSAVEQDLSGLRVPPCTAAAGLSTPASSVQAGGLGRSGDWRGAQYEIAKHCS